MVFEHSVVKTKHICKETENSYSSASNSQTQSQVESSHSKDRSGHAGPWAYYLTYYYASARRIPDQRRERPQSRDDRVAIRITEPRADPYASTDNVEDSTSDTFGALPQMITQKGDAGSVLATMPTKPPIRHTSSSVIAGMRTVGGRQR